MDSSAFLQSAIENLGLEHKNFEREAFCVGSTSFTSRQVIDDKTYFVKHLHPEFLHSQPHRRIFKKEFDTGKQLSHPNIVEYVDFHESDDDCHILMENIEGLTLDDFILAHPDYFSSRKNLNKFFLQMLSGVQYLHEHHIIHSDLKPQNLMISQINNDTKIIDLGFSFTDSYSDTAGATLEYAAPEQKENVDKSRLDVKTDLYCIGKVMEFIDSASAKPLPKFYRRMMNKCLMEAKADRPNDAGELLDSINNHNRFAGIAKIAGVVLLIVAVCIAGLCFHKSDSKYDTVYHFVGYKINQENGSTCSAVGYYGDEGNIILTDVVKIGDTEYRLTAIGDSAFCREKDVETVYLPDGIETIGAASFKGSTINAINMPNSITRIGHEAFRDCDNLSIVKFSPNLKEIAIRSFVDCTGLQELIIPEGVTTLKLDCFVGCINLREVKLPQSLTTMERGVFYACKSLKSIVIPAACTEIGEYVFHECDSLQDIFNHSPIPQDIMPITKTPGKITLHVPAQSAELYRNSYFWNRMNIIGDL